MIQSVRLITLGVVNKIHNSLIPHQWHIRHTSVSYPSHIRVLSVTQPCLIRHIKTEEIVICNYYPKYGDIS